MMDRGYAVAVKLIIMSKIKNLAETKRILVGCKFSGCGWGNITSSHSIKPSFSSVGGKRLAMLCPHSTAQSPDLGLLHSNFGDTFSELVLSFSSV